MKTSDFFYQLPEEQIAQTPVTPRDSSRLMVYQRASGEVSHRQFRQLPDFLRKDDLLVFNKTRVIRARLFGKKIPTGGKVEILLLKRIKPRVWQCMVGGKGIRKGTAVQLQDGPRLEVISELEGPLRIIQVEELLSPYLERNGHVPLPPYIHQHLENPERYQTVYGEVTGSSAAPTAGLHFTEDLIHFIQDQGVLTAEVVLHVGLDTFAPVREEDPELHKIHTEWCQLPFQTADRINRTRKRGGRIIAVGTTTARTLETAGQILSNSGQIQPYQGFTDLFILPGYNFQVVDCLITNFHLPESTLLMMVSAFAGRETVLDLYQQAIQNGYRFYSFGDAMLIE